MNIAHQRLYNHRLITTEFEKPSDVVAWLGAVQAQEYAHAKWALSQRMHEGFTDTEMERAFTNGEILRTHVMRPTWHFVTATDIRWMLELTGPRVDALNGTMYRKLELDDALFAKTNAALTKFLAGGKQMTRVEIGKALAEIGIVADGVRLGYIVHRAELDAVVCSGPRRGKQFTYMLLDERAPHAKSLPRDEALATLVKRFFTSHGPATVQDFARWSGLTVADGKAGLEMNKPDLISETIDGDAYWFSVSTPILNDVPMTAHFLPIYDEYTIGYKGLEAIIKPEYAEAMKNNNWSIFASTLEIQGYLVGVWRRTFEKKGVTLETQLFAPLTADQNAAYVAAIERFGKYWELPVVLS